MVRLPWRDRKQDDIGDGDTSAESGDQSDYHLDAEPVVSCQFQDGKLFVFEDQLFIERAGKSKFSDKWVALDRVTSVTYAKRLVISYLQIEQEGFDNSERGLLSTPVDENTLHFGHGKRDCAKQARDAISERLS